MSGDYRGIFGLSEGHIRGRYESNARGGGNQSFNSNCHCIAEQCINWTMTEEKKIEKIEIRTLDICEFFNTFINNDLYDKNNFTQKDLRDKNNFTQKDLRDKIRGFHNLYKLSRMEVNYPCIDFYYDIKIFDIQDRIYYSVDGYADQVEIYFVADRIWYPRGYCELWK